MGHKLYLTSGGYKMYRDDTSIAGQPAPVSFKGTYSFTFTAAAGDIPARILDSGNRFITQGFTPGEVFFIKGTTNNNGLYITGGVTAGIMDIVSPLDLTTEAGGPKTELYIPVAGPLAAESISIISGASGDKIENTDGDVGIETDRSDNDTIYFYVVGTDEAQIDANGLTLKRDRKSTRLNSSHPIGSRMPSSA